MHHPAQSPHHLLTSRDKQSNKWRAQSASTLHPRPNLALPREELAQAFPLLYLFYTSDLLSACSVNTKISTCGLTAQQGGSTIALQLHIGLAVRQPGTGRTADTNILITHGCEGFRGGDGSGVRACAALTHSL